mmetsp:Transcript_10695/g.16775  ORF Transcript_10695/g.16775 Transcript_10695/m.16775 type:complete len:105 (+) Transcript_10695:908-1222(+)|eukprot:CAMPEP_0184327950 /NCGR_PEP_ID=MMETSP1049-20130417/143364_1 /TAXON_ID=77928 /ORGANISM="Proteomonas sulcata, Strain CCMP704" /LENGTH=104 /DNA_ID=CAMNT_0026650233 /DNA_START=922 /DNA_END=1236 /DNA_ORIENTATION=-
MRYNDERLDSHHNTVFKEVLEQIRDIRLEMKEQTEKQDLRIEEVRTEFYQALREIKETSQDSGQLESTMRSYTSEIKDRLDQNDKRVDEILEVLIKLGRSEKSY